MTHEKDQKLAGLKRTYCASVASVCSATTDAQISLASRRFVENLHSLGPADDDVFDLFLAWISNRQSVRLGQGRERGRATAKIN